MSEVAAHPASRLVLLAAGAIAGALLALTIGLWAYYGTAVFHEIILAGLAACF